MNKLELKGSKVAEIIEVAGRLFSKKGYKATSLKEIADLVGLHKTSLFHYFKSKEEILIRVMDLPMKEHLNYLNDIINKTHLSSEEKFRLALREQVLILCRYTDHINVWLTEIRSLSPHNQGIYNRKRKEYELQFEKIIKEIQKDPKTDLFKGLDSKIATLAILGMSNWVLKWYHYDGPLRPEEIFENFYNMIIRGNAPTK